MKPTLSLLLAVTHLGVVLFPAFDPHEMASADETPARLGLDRQLRRAGEARVWIVKPATPGGQFLVQPGDLLVRSPRATSEGLRFASVAEPASWASRDTGFTWERVDEIQVRMNHAGRGALVGGVMLGAVGAVAAAVGSDLGLNPSYDPQYLTGIGVGFVVGAVLGAAVGSVSRSWVKVYP